MLIGLFNPTVKTMRGLCAATQLKGLQRQWGCGPMSVGSVSEAQHLVEPELLRGVIEELNSEVRRREQQRPHPSDPGPRPRGACDERLAAFDLRAVDSTLLAALPRMAWAVYGGGRAGFLNNAVRFHLSFDPVASRPVEFKLSKMSCGLSWSRSRAISTISSFSMPRKISVGSNADRTLCDLDR